MRKVNWWCTWGREEKTVKTEGQCDLGKTNWWSPWGREDENCENRTALSLGRSTGGAPGEGMKILVDTGTR